MSVLGVASEGKVQEGSDTSGACTHAPLLSMIPISLLVPSLRVAHSILYPSVAVFVYVHKVHCPRS